MNASEFKQTFLPATARLYGLALRLTGNGDEAEDLVQETFLKLWLQRKDLPDMSSPSAYAVSVLRHLWIDSGRRATLQVVDTAAEKFSLTDDNDLSRQVEHSDASDHIKRLIDQLPEQQRLVITLHDLEGRDNDEIASLTGLTANNIRVLLSRARKAIRQQFNGND